MNCFSTDLLWFGSGLDLTKLGQIYIQETMEIGDQFLPNPIQQLKSKRDLRRKMKRRIEKSQILDVTSSLRFEPYLLDCTCQPIRRVMHMFRTLRLWSLVSSCMRHLMVKYNTTRKKSIRSTINHLPPRRTVRGEVSQGLLVGHVNTEHVTTSYLLPLVALWHHFYALSFLPFCYSCSLFH